MKLTITELTERVESEAEASRETQADLEELVAIVSEQESMILEKSVELFKKETTIIKEGSEKAVLALKEKISSLEEASEEEKEKLLEVQSHLEKLTETVESEQE